MDKNHSAIFMVAFSPGSWIRSSRPRARGGFSKAERIWKRSSPSIRVVCLTLGTERRCVGGLLSLFEYYSQHSFWIEHTRSPNDANAGASSMSTDLSNCYWMLKQIFQIEEINCFLLSMFPTGMLNIESWWTYQWHKFSPSSGWWCNHSQMDRERAIGY